jgi:hypothetical protein
MQVPETRRARKSATARNKDDCVLKAAIYPPVQQEPESLYSGIPSDLWFLTPERASIVPRDFPPNLLYLSYPTLDTVAK